MIIPSIVCVIILFSIFLTGLVSIIIIVSNRDCILHTLYGDCDITISPEFTYFNPSHLTNKYNRYISSGCLNFIGKIYNNDINKLKYFNKELSIYNDYDNKIPFVEIWKSSRYNNIFITMRGTSSNTYTEWFNNMKSSQISNNDCQFEHKPSILKHKDVRIHKGFVNIYNMIWPVVLKYINTIPNNYNICLTGHSIGGSLCTIMSYDIKDYFENVCVYSYGSPKIGNPEFCKQINNKVSNIFRVVNRDDSFTETPTSVYPNFKQPSKPFVYSHCGKEISFVENTGTIEGNHCLTTYMKHY